MDGKQMRQVLAMIQDLGNISLTAEALYLSQPYLTRSIHEAEQRIGNQILNRDHQPMTLTYAGKQYLDYLTTTEQAAHNFELKMEALNGYSQGILKLGTNRSLGQLIYPTLIKRLKESFPELTIELDELTTKHAQYKMMAGELDYFVGMPMDHQGHWQIESIFIDRLGLFGTNGSFIRQAHQQANDVLRNVNQLPLIVLPADTNYQQMVDQYLKERKILRPVIMEIPDIVTAAELAISGVGQTILPALYVARNQRWLKQMDVRFAPLSGISSPVELAYLKKGPTFSVFRKALLQIGADFQLAQDL